jgi:hypothetical protein
MPKNNSTQAKSDDLKWTQAALVLVAVGMIFGAILST